jgi:hypothetical protein
VFIYTAYLLVNHSDVELSLRKPLVATMHNEFSDPDLPNPDRKHVIEHVDV